MEETERHNFYSYKYVYNQVEGAGKRLGIVGTFSSMNEHENECFKVKHTAKN